MVTDKMELIGCDFFGENINHGTIDFFTSKENLLLVNKGHNMTHFISLNSIAENANLTQQDRLKDPQCLLEPSLRPFKVRHTHWKSRIDLYHHGKSSSRETAKNLFFCDQRLKSDE